MPLNMVIQYGEVMDEYWIGTKAGSCPNISHGLGDSMLICSLKNILFNITKCTKLFLIVGIWILIL